jgi:hypothetical protein
MSRFLQFSFTREYKDTTSRFWVTVYENYDAACKYCRLSMCFITFINTDAGFFRPRTGWGLTEFNRILDVKALMKLKTYRLMPLSAHIISL